MPQVMEYAEEESERELTEQERLQRMGQFEMALTDKIGRVEKEEEYYHVSVPKPCVPMVLVLQFDNQMDKFWERIGSKIFFRSRCKNVNLASNAANIDILFYTCQSKYVPMAGNLSHNKMITSACSNVFLNVINESVAIII